MAASWYLAQHQIYVSHSIFSTLAFWQLHLLNLKKNLFLSELVNAIDNEWSEEFYPLDSFDISMNIPILWF